MGLHERFYTIFRVWVGTKKVLHEGYGWFRGGREGCGKQLKVKPNEIPILDLGIFSPTRFPKYGWKVKLNHEFAERRDQNLQPSPGQMVQLLPLGLRCRWSPDHQDHNHTDHDRGDDQIHAMVGRQAEGREQTSDRPVSSKAQQVWPAFTLTWTNPIHLNPFYWIHHSKCYLKHRRSKSE